MGPTFNLKNKKIKNKINIKKSSSRTEGQTEVSEILFYFYLLNLFFYSRVFDRRISSGQTRKVLYSTRATRGNQKHGISPRFQVKVWKILSF